MTIDITKPVAVEKIENLLTENENLLFVLSEGEFSRDYILSIQNQLPNHVVTEMKLLNKLIIASSISTSTVIENLNEFYECIELFDKTAHFLMNLMAETFKIDLSISSELYDLKRNRSERQRGYINSEWGYHFHGKGCSFTNRTTNQFLDVQIINGLEFGELDTYYLMKFIQTTKSLNAMSLILKDKTSNMRKVIETLWINDY